MTDSSTTKPCSVSFAYHKDFMYVLLDGTHYDSELIKSCLKEVYIECESRNCDQILLEKAILEPAALVDIYNVASELTDMGFAKIRMAFVDRYAEKNDQDAFCEIIASSYGMDCKLFDSVPEAEEWLVNRVRS